MRREKMVGVNLRGDNSEAVSEPWTERHFGYVE